MQTPETKIKKKFELTKKSETKDKSSEHYTGEDYNRMQHNIIRIQDRILDLREELDLN